MERLQGSHSVPGWNDSRGVILIRDGKTAGESFCPGMERLQGSQSVLEMERLQGSPSVLGCTDSRGVILSRDGTTPGESFCPGMERFQGSHSVPGWNDSRGVILLGMKRLQGSHSVPGWYDSRGVLLSRDGTTPGESFSTGMERL